MAEGDELEGITGEVGEDADQPEGPAEQVDQQAHAQGVGLGRPRRRVLLEHRRQGVGHRRSEGGEDDHARAKIRGARLPAALPAVLILSASMGAGHDGAAAELAVRLQSAGYRVRTADFLECFPWRLGRLMRWVYTVQLKAAPWAYEATFRVWYLTPLLGRALEVVLTVLTGRRLRQLLRSEPGLACVVATYPLSSLVLGRGRRRGWVGAPVATFVTDFGVHPLWMHPAVDLTMCVHRSSAEVAARATARSVVTTGPMVSAAFRRAPITKLAARQALGLPQEAKIALAVSGSWGVGDLESTFDALLHTDDWLPVAVCGRNDDLRARLASRGGGVVLGWTDRMPELMAAADVLVQNAGGLSCMEAFAVDLPVVTFHPIPGHGRKNAAEMEAAGVAVLAGGPEELVSVLDPATGPGRGAMVAAGRRLFRGDPAACVHELVTAHRGPGAAPAGVGPRPASRPTPYRR